MDFRYIREPFEFLAVLRKEPFWIEVIRFPYLR